MDASLFKTLGQIAGVGGVALGVLLIVFRDVIRKNIFPTLDPRDAYKLIRLIVVLVFIVALVGLGLWAWTPKLQSGPVPTSPPVVQTPPPPVKFVSHFQFRNTNFNLSAAQQFNYGFSSVESDKDVQGQGIKIDRLRVDMTVRVHKGFPCCDLWVMLGPGPFGYQNGGVVNGPNPFQIDPATNLAPVQVRFVVGNGGVAYSPNSEANLYATYEFDPQIAKGDVDRLKGAFGAPLNLPGGLYAQIFMWNGNPNVDLDVESLTLTVEGLRP